MNKHILLTICLFAMLNLVKAEIKLPPIFADGMLLQQKTTTKIWGKATPDKKVTIFTSWNLKKHTVMADKDGNWVASIETSKAGGPYTMIISDGKALTINNILLGELWICSGQSNMEMPMKGFQSQPIEGGNMDILRGENSKLRLFTVKRAYNMNPVAEMTGRWEEAMPISVKEFSATAYYFGRLLQETLKVPVGLIATSWGGSSIEAWMDKEMLQSFPQATLPTTNENVKNPHQTPTMLYNAMINPLVGYATKGFIWYQGESNASRYQTYTAMMKQMVEGWRARWNQKDTIPFYYCQIAPYGYNSNMNSAFLREAQMKAVNVVPKTGMAVLMDTGEKLNIHPAKKKDAGERLALLALNKTYNITAIGCETPAYQKIEISNDTATVFFTNVAMGIAAKDFKSDAFTMCGPDKKFYPAKAKINRTRIIVTSDSVKTPVAVRYAFENYVVGDLFSVDGLPLSSFRSDDFKE
jgi:sialate O-acetylesterase